MSEFRILKAKSASPAADEVISALLKRIPREMNTGLSKEPVKVTVISEEESDEKINTEFDIVLHSAIDMTREQYESFCKAYRFRFAYVLNTYASNRELKNRSNGHFLIKELGRNAANKVLFRDTVLGSVEIDPIYNDWQNIFYLLNSGKKPGKEWNSFIKRFFDASFHKEDFNMMFCFNNYITRSYMNVANQWEVEYLSIYPSTMKRSVYDKMLRLNSIQNDLWMRMSYDCEFMLKELETMQGDPWVKRATQLYKKTLESSFSQKTKLLLSRNDYMVQPDLTLKQVEINTAAVGWFTNSDLYAKAMKEISVKYGDEHSMEPNGNTEQMAETILKTFHCYGNPKAMIVVMAPANRIVNDEFYFARKLWEAGVTYKRYSPEELDGLLERDETTGRLFILGQEVAFVYYRYAYTAAQYDECLWRVREKIECSMAIKCPDISLHLVGTKLFQYVTAKQATWTHFGFSKDLFEEVSKTYCDMKKFEDDFQCSKDKLREYIRERGGVKNFLLKKEGDGGGNHYAYDEITTRIDEDTEEVLKGYMLVSRIHPHMYVGMSTDWHAIQVLPTCDEIGFYHYSIYNGPKDIIHKKNGGILICSMINGNTSGENNDTRVTAMDFTED